MVSSKDTLETTKVGNQDKIEFSISIAMVM